MALSSLVDADDEDGVTPRAAFLECTTRGWGTDAVFGRESLVLLGLA
jgi:hypothetical protein